jgi:putative salt-induced outer membrane protein YdiY
VLTSRFLLLPLLASGLLADQVVLKNGDVVTGSIIKKDAGKLTIKSEFLGEVSMPWTAVQSLRSDEPLTVELPGDQRVLGRITTQNGNLQIATATETRTAALADIGAVRNPAEQRSWERLQDPGILDLWTGYVDLGLALARGNARAETLTTNMSATRVTRNDKIAVNFNQIYGTARVNNVTSSIANAIRGGWSYNRDVSPRFFVTAINQYEYDSFQRLDLRFVAGGGFGVNAIKTPDTNLSFMGGANYMKENFTDGIKRNSAEASFGNDFVHKLSAVTNLKQSFRMNANLSNPGEYRITFDLAAVTAINKWLGWQVTASDRYLSNPVLGRQRNDLLLSTGLRLTFAR